METSRSSGHGLVKGLVAFLGCAFLVLVVLSVLDHSARAVQPAAVAAVPSVPSVQMLWWSGQPAANTDDLRLQTLEDTAGITRYVWGMEIPAGKKWVLRFHGGDSDSKPTPRLEDYTYEITGPLAASFGNRFSFVKYITNQNQTEQIKLEIHTQLQDRVTARSGTGAFMPVDVNQPPDWNGEGPSWESPQQIPGTVWEEHGGPKSSPHQVSFQLDVALAPADPGTTPGEIISPKK